MQVEAKGLAVRTFERVQPGVPLLVTLERGRTIEGRVRDAADQPVPRARLVARSQSSIASSLWDPEANRLETTADARGRYRLDGVGPGLYTVTARALGGAARNEHVRPGAVDFVIQPKASLSGVVLDGDRRPVPGAIVRAEPEPLYGGSSDMGKTDAQGRFELLGLDAGTYAMVAYHADFAPAVTSGLRVEGAGHADTTLVLTSGVAVIGRTLGPEEQPVVGRVAVQETSGQPAPRSLVELLRTEAGADGRFRIEHVPAGAFALSVMAHGFAGQRVEVEVTGRESVVDLGDVLLDLGLAIRGRLRTREGAPVVDAALRAWQPDPQRGGTPGQGSSGSDGAFVLAGLSPGPYMVSVSAPRLRPLPRRRYSQAPTTSSSSSTAAARSPASSWKTAIARWTPIACSRAR